MYLVIVISEKGNFHLLDVQQLNQNTQAYMLGLHSEV